ncbi:hypothetical protein HD554DRAFT_2141586 [Boletus coccyginus]|nr:hypothetical protein HD554DRAFT_2141586 [Boletus coccyginus]
MSTATSTNIRDNDEHGTLVDAKPFSPKLYRLLLYIEALMGSCIVSGYLFIGQIFFLSQCHNETPAYLVKHFGALTGFLAFTLFGNIRSAARRNTACQKFWHILFHIPFLVEMLFLGYTAYITLPAPLPEWLSGNIALNVVCLSLNASVPLGIILFTAILLLFHFLLDCIHQNMMSATRNLDDQAGLIVIDSWVVRPILAITQQGHPGPGPSATSTTGRHHPRSESLRKKSKVEIWISSLVLCYQHYFIVLQLNASGLDMYSARTVSDRFGFARHRREQSSSPQP